jgi:hypothetical protein
VYGAFFLSEDFVDFGKLKRWAKSLIAPTWYTEPIDQAIRYLSRQSQSDNAQVGKDLKPKGWVRVCKDTYKCPKHRHLIRVKSHSDVFTQIEHIKCLGNTDIRIVLRVMAQQNAEDNKKKLVEGIIKHMSYMDHNTFKNNCDPLESMMYKSGSGVECSSIVLKQKPSNYKHLLT